MATDRFVRAYKNLRYLAAQRTTVTVGTVAAEFQVCQISFSKRDGSIFVSFPYLPEQAGVLSIAKFPEDQTGSVTLSFGDDLTTTSHLAKYSHHPDGLALFSQDGKIRSEVRRRSFRLDGPLGHLFQLHIYNPNGFTRFDGHKRKPDRIYTRNIFTDGLPDAVTVRAEWRRKEGIVDNIDPPTGVSGPTSRVKSRMTGEEFVVHFVGAPDSFPLQEHVLMLTVGATRSLPNIDQPSLIFLGGYDFHEVPTAGMPSKQTSCLLAMYPATSHSELVARARNIDFIPPAS